VLDFAVVVPDIVLEAIGLVVGGLPSLSFFRILRLFRLARAFRILTWFPELFSLIKGLAFALKAIFWGTVLILIFLLIWSIMAVQFIHPLNRELQKNGVWDATDCARCPEAFSSVPMSMLTFIQQIVAGDSWGLVTVPIVEAYPVTIVFFLSVFVSVGLAILNLILAVIVDKAADAKQDSLRIEMEKKKKARHQAHETLRQICGEMDEDGSGTLTYQELVDGFTNDEAFAEVCSHMDITLDDLQVVWSLLDSDGSGDIDYDEFVTQLYKMKSDDSHTLLILIRAYVGDIKRIVTGEMGLLKEELTTKHDLMHTILQEVHSHLGLGKSGIDATSPDDADPKPLSDQECVIAGPKVVKQESVVSGVVQADQTLQAPNLVLTEQVSELEKAIGRLVDVSVELTQKMPISVSLQQGKDGERPCEQGVEAKLDETILARVAGNLVEVQRDQVQRDQVRAAPTDGLCALGSVATRKSQRLSHWPVTRRLVKGRDSTEQTRPPTSSDRSETDLLRHLCGFQLDAR